MREKISNYCNVDSDEVISLTDQSSVYRVPLELEKQGLVKYFIQKFKLHVPEVPVKSFLLEWRRLADRYDNMDKSVSIALVGKYTKLKDAYASVNKALEHSALACNRKLHIAYIESECLEKKMKSNDPKRYYEAWQELCDANGLIVPGGFGDRGVDGKVLAIQYARTKKLPFLGVCLGYQCAVLELCRNVLNMADAESQEANREAANPVIIEMPEHTNCDLGGTMRVGSRVTNFVLKGSIIHRLYKCADQINERHRHRYEVNPAVVPALEQAGMMFVGKDDTGQRMEIMELIDHPYFVGVQFHPEYTSRPLKPSPPYYGLILAAMNKLNEFLDKQTKIKRRKRSSIKQRRTLPLKLIMLRSELCAKRKAIETYPKKSNCDF